MATSPEENKTVASRVHSEIIEDGNIDLVEELYAADAVIHGGPSGDLEGRDAIQAYFESLKGAMSPVSITEDLVLAEDDFVAIRRTDTVIHEGELFGVEPTGQEITFTSNVIARVEDGEIAEVWLASPMLELFAQLGVVELPEE